jgi:hypothetical protein
VLKPGVDHGGQAIAYLGGTQIIVYAAPVEPDAQMTINLSPATRSALFNAAARDGVSYENLIGRSVRFYELAAATTPGHVATLETPKGDQLQVLVLPARVSIFAGFVHVNLGAGDCPAEPERPGPWRRWLRALLFRVRP